MPEKDSPNNEDILLSRLKAGEHRAFDMIYKIYPAGALRSGKYSVFEGGTRIPFIVSGAGIAKGKTSDALICQMGLLASVANMLGQEIPKGDATDSEPLWDTFLGKDTKGRSYLVEHAGSLAIIKENWKYIEPSKAPAYAKLTDTELENAPVAQLYDLSKEMPPELWTQ